MSHEHLPELIVHIPEVDPARKRWFIVSVVTTSALVVGGWAYFLFGQVSALATSVPKTFASDFFPSVVEGAKQVGADTAEGFQTTVAPLASEALGQVQARIEAQQTVGAAVKIMAEKMTEDAQAAESDSAEPTL